VYADRQEAGAGEHPDEALDAQLARVPGETAGTGEHAPADVLGRHHRQGQDQREEMGPLAVEEPVDDHWGEQPADGQQDAQAPRRREADPAHQRRGSQAPGPAVSEGPAQFLLERQERADPEGVDQSPQRGQRAELDRPHGPRRGDQVDAGGDAEENEADGHRQASATHCGSALDGRVSAHQGTH
jgi:hypothetical protein